MELDVREPGGSRFAPAVDRALHLLQAQAQGLREAPPGLPRDVEDGNPPRLAPRRPRGACRPSASSRRRDRSRSRAPPRPRRPRCRPSPGGWRTGGGRPGARRGSGGRRSPVRGAAPPRRTPRPPPPRSRRSRARAPRCRTRRRRPVPRTSPAADSEIGESSSPTPILVVPAPQTASRPVPAPTSKPRGSAKVWKNVPSSPTGSRSSDWKCAAMYSAAAHAPGAPAARPSRWSAASHLTCSHNRSASTGGAAHSGAPWTAPHSRARMKARTGSRGRRMATAKVPAAALAPPRSFLQSLANPWEARHAARCVLVRDAGSGRGAAGLRASARGRRRGRRDPVRLAVAHRLRRRDLRGAALPDPRCRGADGGCLLRGRRRRRPRATPGRPARRHRAQRGRRGAAAGPPGRGRRIVRHGVRPRRGPAPRAGPCPLLRRLQRVGGLSRGRTSRDPGGGARAGAAPRQSGRGLADRAHTRRRQRAARSGSTTRVCSCRPTGAAAT